MMRRIGFAFALCVAAAGTAANAQEAGGISNIQSSAGSSVLTSPFGDPAIFGPGAGVTTGAAYNSYVTVAPNLITFESENTSSAQFVNTNSYSSVSFDVTNNTGQQASFTSTITAAGLGFYLADTSGGCLYTGCPQVAAGSYTFNDLVSDGGVASVGFNFTVSRAGTFDNSPATLYSLSGTLGMGRDGSLILFDSLGSEGGFDGEVSFPGTGPRGLLNGFAAADGTDYDPSFGIGAATALGYAWDATDFEFDIGDFQNQTLVYTTQVFSNSTTPCIEGTSICLVAYSGFGDPIGRGGGIDSLFAALTAFDGPVLNSSSGGRITGLNFGPSYFATPTFDGLHGTFLSTTAPGVPEPATWMTLILGFGLLGAAMRRRRTLAVA